MMAAIVESQNQDPLPPTTFAYLHPRPKNYLNWNGFLLLRATRKG